MLSELLNILGTVGDVMDKPRQAVWQGISGLAGKEYKGAGDALIDMGMDPDSYLTKGLGFAGDMATDPLTWAGMLGGTQLARQGVKRLPTAVEGLARAGATAEELMTTPALRNLGQRVTQFENVIPGSADDASTFLKHLGVDSAGKPTSGLELDELLGHVEKGLGDKAKGVYKPSTASMGTRPGAAVGYKRHELMHGLTDQAAKTGQVGELPWFSQPAGYLKQGVLGQAKAAGIDPGNVKGELRGAATLFDEMGAHWAGGTTPLESAQSVGGFLFHPRKIAPYAQTLVKRGAPRTAALYRGLGANVPGAAAAALAAPIPQETSQLLKLLNRSQGMDDVRPVE